LKICQRQANRHPGESTVGSNLFSIWEV